MDLTEEQMLRVNLSTGEIRVEPLSPMRTWQSLGPRGRAAACLLTELDPAAEPLGPSNKLVFAVGRSAGLSLPGSCRLVVAGLSPATGLYGEAEAGGSWAAALWRAGFSAIVVEGCAERPVYLAVTGRSAALRDASRIWGLTTFEAEEALKAELMDPAAQALVIGPAGERSVPCACILHAGVSAAGRAGLGAVMGAKGLKAVVVRSPTGDHRLAGRPGCAGCPRPCRSTILGHKTRRAFAELGLVDEADIREANRLCNAYGLDTLAAAAALQGRVKRTDRRVADQVLRLIPVLARGELTCPAGAGDGEPRQFRGIALPEQRATAVLGVCRWVVAPGGPLTLQDVLRALGDAIGVPVSVDDLLREADRTAEAVAAFNRRVAACRTQVV